LKKKQEPLYMRLYFRCIFEDSRKVALEKSCWNIWKIIFKF